MNLIDELIVLNNNNVQKKNFKGNHNVSSLSRHLVSL